METEGPTTEHGGEEPGTNNNVVPFPRDWLGPREELIPFGNSAGYGVEQSTAAPGAEAFWGGDSGPLHAVLPEPVAAGGAAGARVRMRAGRLAVAGLAAAVLAAAVFGRLAGLPAGSNPSVGSGVAAAGFFDLALLRGAVGAPAIESSKPAVHRSPAVRARPIAHVRHRPAAGSRTSGSGSTARRIGDDGRGHAGYEHESDRQLNRELEQRFRTRRNFQRSHAFERQQPHRNRPSGTRRAGRAIRTGTAQMRGVRVQ